MNKRIIAGVILMVLIGLIVYTLMFPVDMAALDGYESKFYSKPIALIPPIIAILLALITKEVYSSLFLGIVSGALLYSNFNLELALNTMFFNEDGGMLYKIADTFNA